MHLVITLLFFMAQGYADLRLQENGGSNYVGFKAPASITTDLLWTMPSADGTSGQCLGTDGAAGLKWVTLAAGSGDMMASGTVAMVGALTLPVGSAGTPSLSFSGDTNTGFFFVAATTMGLSLGGTERLRMGATSAGISAGAQPGIFSGANVATYSASGDTDNGFYRINTDTLGLTTANAERMRITSTGLWGFKTTSPQGLVDVNGEIRIKKNAAEPVACSATYNGRIALTSAFTACVCNGTSWVRTNDGTTACTW